MFSIMCSMMVWPLIVHWLEKFIGWSLPSQSLPLDFSYKRRDLLLWSLDLFLKSNLEMVCGNTWVNIVCATRLQTASLRDWNPFLEESFGLHDPEFDLNEKHLYEKIVPKDWVWTPTSCSISQVPCSFIARTSLASISKLQKCLTGTSLRITGHIRHRHLNNQKGRCTPNLQKYLYH